MAQIKQVTRYAVDGQEFKSLAEADAMLLDRLGEELHELIKEHLPDYAHRKGSIDFTCALWNKRDTFRDLLTVGYEPQECYCDDDT